MDNEAKLQQRKLAIAARVSEILAEKGWTQRDLARRIGMKDSYVSALLAGQINLTLKTIIALEQGLGKKLIDVL